MKRIFDIFFSLIVLFFTFPIFILSALAIKLDSPGRVFFRQKRVGKNGKIFTILKFRTMKEMSGQILTAKGDFRITRIGRILRRTNFDEIPQFINILKGKMSVVGPRPEIVEIVEKYTPEQKKILLFKPGFTSPATIKFLYEESILENKDIINYYLNEILPEKIKSDIEYFTKKYNLFRDIIIILKTIGRTFNG